MKIQKSKKIELKHDKKKVNYQLYKNLMQTYFLKIIRKWQKVCN